MRAGRVDTSVTTGCVVSLLASALLLPAASGCSSSGSSSGSSSSSPPGTSAPANPCRAPQASSAAAASLASADARFAVALYRQTVAGSTTSNAVLSPYSISAALTMLDVGAAGDTATQIQTTPDLPGTGATVAPAFATLECEDEADGALAGKLAIANALFGQTGARFEPSFLSVLANGYGAALQRLDDAITKYNNAK